MSECFNSELKEYLPEFAAGALQHAALVEAHVATCEHCVAELEIIRAVRGSVIPVVHINVPKIVSALPSAPVPVAEDRPWYRRAGLQMAAAFLLVAGGAYSVRQAGDRVAASPAIKPAASADVHSGPIAPPPEPGNLSGGLSRSSAPKSTPAPGDIALTVGLDELSTQELTILLQDMDAMAATPVDEPIEFSPVSATEVHEEG